jgi:hypothetical protein
MKTTRQHQVERFAGTNIIYNRYVHGRSKKKICKLDETSDNPGLSQSHLTKGIFSSELLVRQNPCRLIVQARHDAYRYLTPKYRLE